MKEKNIIFTARIMSMIFTPFYLPIVGLIALFIFSYMSLLPMMYKLVMLAMARKERDLPSSDLAKGQEVGRAP